MNVSLKECKAERVHLRNAGYEEEGLQEDVFKLNMLASFISEKPTHFVLFFSALIIQKDIFVLEIEYSALFETTEAIEKDFMKSAFPAVNAPAIAYPFLRSFVSTLCVNAGYGQWILPTVNFTQAPYPTIYLDDEIIAEPVEN